MRICKCNLLKTWLAISVVFLFLLALVSVSAQETLNFGVEEGATWTLHREYVSEWETGVSNETIVFLNATENIVYLNTTVFGEFFQQEQNKTYTYNSTEIQKYNLTDFVEFLNDTVMMGEFPYILPINWSLIESILQQLNQTNKDAEVYFREISREYIGDKPVDVISIVLKLNETYKFTAGNTNYTDKSFTNVEGKYSKKTGILLEENYYYEYYLYNDSTLVETYNITERTWITNSSFIYWETELPGQPSEQPSENETIPEITATTIATSTTGAISGAVSAATAVIATVGVGGVATTATASVGQAVAPSLVAGEQAPPEFESIRSKFSWKYLKYLLKLRKLRRKKKKEEIPPPKNTIKMTVALAIIGAATGFGAAAIAYGLSAPLALSVMVVTAIVGFTLAEAGLSLFIRKYVFFKVRSIKWGKKEKLSLLIILITGLYGVVTSFISTTLMIKAITALATSAIIPTGIIAYFTAEEVTMMTSTE